MPAPVSTREYDVGDVARTTATLKLSGVLTDPTTLTFKYKNPAGTITTLVYGVDAAVVRDSVGTFHCDVPLASEGMWAYRYASTGVAAGAAERRILVRPTEF